MDYTFLYTGDAEVIELAEKPRQGGIAMVARPTGFDTAVDEVLALAVVDLSGNVLFSRTVKPQNRETWEPSKATGGIAPADVEDEPALYEFEDELSAIVENAAFVVCEHADFVEAIIDKSWVSLPEHISFDIVERFLAFHATPDCPDEPATAASLEGIAAYYGEPFATEDLDERAKCLARSYGQLVDEAAQQRDAKGSEYWQRYQERLEKERAEREASNAANRLRERRLTQMNGLLWITGAIIFTSLSIQLYQNGFDAGLIVISVAVALFALSRGIVNLTRK